MAGPDVKPELLEGLREGRFVEEGVCGVREPCLEKVLVQDDVELVRLDYHGH